MKKYIRILGKILPAFVLASIISVNLNAQTGPGGVGNSDGSNGQPENVIWFAADSLSLSNTNPVATWTDISGNGNDGVQGAPGSQPTFLTNQLNGYPIVYFDGATNDFMPFDGTTVVGTNLTAIYVAARRNENYNLVMGGTVSSANSNMHLGWQTATNGIFNHWSNDIEPTLSGDGSGYIGDGDPTDDYGIFVNRLKTDENPARKVFQNGTMIGSLNNTNQLISYTGSALGSRNGLYYDVNIAEVILFSTGLNDAQLQIVTQYLNEKYNIAISNDLFDPIAAYSYGIAGIGEESNGEQSETNCVGLYLTATSGLNVGDYIFASHNNLTNNRSNFRGDAEVANSGADSAYNRLWYIKPIGTPEAQLAFDFSEALEDGLNPTNISNYVLLYRAGASGDFTMLKNEADGLRNGDQVYFNLTSTDINEGYYTLGTKDDVNTPLEGVAGRTWYTLISGNWGDWEIWTLDPSGALPNNPDHLTPNTSPTNTADKVVIKTGRTVEVDTINNLSHSSITVDGRLDLTTTTDHTFGEIRGTGRILMADDNFPDGDASHFVTEGQGEGTVEYYGGTYNLSATREFYDVEIELDNTTDTIKLINDYTINGNLTITQGNLKINDTTDDRLINLTVDGNVLVESNGGIFVGTGNPYDTDNYQIGGTMPADDVKEYHDIFHQFNMAGNFTNRGTVRFTNLSAPDYDSFPADGAVTVRFQGASNAEVNLYNTTDFYNLVVDKGSDKTYKVNLYSDNVSYFKLFGANSVGRTTGAPFSAEDPQIRKALFIHNGTLQLRGNINIPTLSEGADEGGNGDYAVGKNARFWMDGSNVTVYSTASDNSTSGNTQVDDASGASVTAGSSNQAMSVYGEFKISDGYFGTRNSAGFIFWAASNAQVKIEGGTCYVSQVRSAGAGSGVASYIQTGGTMTVFGNEAVYGGEYTGTYPLFGLETSDAVFQMSGGEIILQDNDGDADPEFYVISDEGNYQVTGGTVRFELPNGRTAQIQSTANLWNLDLTNTSSSGNFNLVQLAELTVMGDLNLNNYTTLNSAGFDLNIGDDWEFADGANYIHGSNTVSFVGNGRSYIYVRDNSTLHDLVLNNLALNKDQRWNNDLFHRVEVLTPNTRSTDVSPLLIEGNLTITRGEFDVNRWEVDLQGNIEIIDGQIIETDTPDGKIVLNGSAQQTIKGSLLEEQEFGSFELDNAAGALLLSDINVTNFELTQGIMDLDIYNLHVSGALSTSGTYSNSLMYKTAGNAGDGGITLSWDLSVGASGTAITFPLGSGTQYTPAVITQGSTIADAGEITVNPVDDYHPATTDVSKTIPYYWVVDTANYSTVAYTNLQYTFTYPGSVPSGVKRGSVLWDGDWDWYDAGNVLTGSDLIFPSSAYLTNEFALGNPSIFKKPVVYYSTTAGRGNNTDFNNNDVWTDPTCWSTIGHYSTTNDGDYPQAGDIAIIGFGLDNPTDVTDNNQRSHWFYVDADVDVGKIIFADEVVNADGVSVPRSTSFQPQLIINNDAALDFIAGTVSGNGTFNVEVGCSTCDPDPAVTVPITANIDADFSDFANNPASRFDYDLYLSNNTAAYLPTNFPDVYPNLMIKGQNGTNRKLIFQEDILVKGDLTIRENAVLLLSDTQYGDIEVLDDMNFTINAGDDKLQFPSSGFERTFTLHGDILMEDGDNDEITVLNTTPSGLEHTFRLGGSIDKQSGNTIDLFTDNTGGNNVILELFGDNSATYTSDDNAAEFYRIVLKKEGAGTTRFDFEDAMSLNGPTNSDPKALELISGTIDFNDSGIDIMLTSGGEDFKIPQDAELQASWAKMRVSGNNTGIWLDGAIRVGYASEWYLNEGTNNYIEYTSSGVSEIAIYQGDFYVGSQIRRSANTEEGILNFRQEHLNSTVIIGTDANLGGETDRGVFELVNTGSNFSQVTGAKMTIANAVPNATVPSFYLDLAASELSLAAGSMIEFGGDSAKGSSGLTLYSSQPLKNVELNNNSANNPSLTLETVELALDTLIIDSGTTFDANGLSLNLYGDFINNGTFTANENSTYFLGSVNQNITGVTTFYNLHKTSLNQLTLNDDVDVDNELNLNVGTFNDGDNTLSVQGNVNMDIVHTWGESSNGILFNGSSQQVLTGDGTFGKLAVNNSAGITIPQGNELTISGELQLESGVLDIGKNLLALTENAQIREQNPFSETNMIQTNISFTDAGIKKFFPAISASTTFIYPIGSEGKYSPLELNISSMDAGGSIRVKAANEMHPTIVNDDEPCDEITDTLNVLKYHWLMEADNVTGFNANASMKYYIEDYQENSTFYDETDYIAARLLAGSTLWNKYDPASFDEGNSLLRFSFTNDNDEGISGDYTAGVEDQDGTCEGAIPDEVPAYISVQNGDWTDASTWETYPDNTGTVPPNGPRGAVAIVEHEVTIPSNYILNYKTTINATGVLKVDTTFGHRLGIVEGEGSLQLMRGNLPAGIYDDFFSRTGGTIEFTGDTDYDVLSEVNNVRNLKFTGTGERRLPNLDFEVYGLFTIDGSDGDLWVINEHNRNMTLDSNVVFNQGKFDAGADVGADKPTVTFGGTQQQVISGTGSFTGSNAFNNVIMNNSAGVLLSSPVEVDGTLALNLGIITTDATNVLTVNNDSEIAVSRVNSSTSNYIDGPMRKFIQTNGNFEFPVGDAGRFGEIVVTNATASSSSYWETEYFNANPDLHTPTSLDTSSRETALEMVSGNEYWRVAGPEATSTSDVTIRWDDQSALPAMTDNRATNLHIAQWVAGSPDQWQIVGDVLTNTSVNQGTLKTSSAVTLQEHYFTIASEESAPLATATFTNNDTSICLGQSVTLSIDLTGDPNWSITIEEGGDSQTINNIAASPYIFSVDSAGTYSITAVSDNNGAGTVFGPDVTVSVVPVPTAFNMTGGGSYCEGTGGVTVGLANSELDVNYELFADLASAGVWAGTGSALDFGNQTNTSTITYSVVATSTAGGCTQNMATTVDVTENPSPTATITVVNDTICHGDYPVIDIDFTTAAVDWDLVIDNGTNPVETINNVADPYSYTPAAPEFPQWIDDGTPDTDYVYSIEITDSNGCVNTFNSPTITVFKIPETGPQYHVPNDFGN